MPDFYYRENLAMVHHLAYGSYADRCAPGIVNLLEPYRGAVILELGCGSGALTRHLVEAGHEVIATDASPAFIEIAERAVPDATFRILRLPDDEMPEASAVVSVGHLLNYLPTLENVQTALTRVADALRSHGIFVTDLLDPSAERAVGESSTQARVEDEWAIFATVRRVDETHLERAITTFVRQDGESWTRDDEVHNNLLVDAQAVASVFDADFYEVTVGNSFGRAQLPDNMISLIVSRLE